jgi:flavorubredoxin
MPVRLIGKNILEVGAAHPDRQLFDCLMPTPHGTTYNSYLIAGGQKTALIDAVDPLKIDILLANLEEAGIDSIDYLISLHTEQDHAGGDEAFLRRFPMAKIVATAKVKELTISHLHIPPERFIVINEGDVLDLGGKTLRFMPIPFAHWPDNTMVYLAEERILFSSDLFGTHYAESGDIPVSPEDHVFHAKTYYAEIMAPFRQPRIARYTTQVKALNPALIAPAHGPVWNDPNLILSHYEQWTGDAVQKLVAIPYVSMHDSTRVMVSHLADALTERGLSVVCRDLGSRLDSLPVETGHLITDLVDAAAVIMATPSILGGPHPNVAYAAMIAAAMRPKTRFLGLIGSYGWGQRTEETMTALTANIKAERLETVLVKGLPRADDLARLDKLADTLTEKIRALPALID